MPVARPFSVWRNNIAQQRNSANPRSAGHSSRAFQVVLAVEASAQKWRPGILALAQLQCYSTVPRDATARRSRATQVVDGHLILRKNYFFLYSRSLAARSAFASAINGLENSSGKSRLECSARRCQATVHATAKRK